MVDNNDNIEYMMMDLLTKSLKTLINGAIDIDIEGQSALRFEVNKGRERINVDFIHPAVLQIAESEDEGLFDKLKTAKEFSHKLTSNGLTLSFLRKGKEAITLGKDAHPTLSKLITRSGDIQIDSIRESIKLGRDLKSKEK